MELAYAKQTHHSPFLYGAAELVNSDTNYSSPLPEYNDETDRRINKPEITCAEILSELGNGIWNFFKEGLKVAGIYHPLNKFFGTDSYKNDVEQLSLQLNKQLNKKFTDNVKSVSSIQHTDGKKRLTANLYNRKQLIAIFEQIEKDINKSGDPCNVSDELSISLRVLRKRHTAEHLSIEEKAIISLSFKQLAVNCQHALETKKEKLPIRDQWVTTIIGDLNTMFEYWSVESLAEKIRVELAQKKQVKLGQYSLDSDRILAGVATPASETGTYVEGGLKGSHDHMTLTDAEGFRNKYHLVMGGVYVEGAAGIKGPDEERVKAQLKGALDIQFMAGTFSEPKTTMDEVVRDFKALVNESKHFNDPDIKPYISRARLLNQELDTESKGELDNDLVNVINEVENIEQIRKDFKLKKDGIDQHLSLYMSSLPVGPQSLESQIRLTASDKPVWASAPVKVASGDGTDAIVIGGVGKLTVGAEAKISLLEKETANDKTDVIVNVGIGANLSAFGSGEAMVRNRSEVKRTLTGLRYVDATKSDEEKASIERQIKAGFDIFKNEIGKSTVKIEHTKLGAHVLLMAGKAVEPNRKNYESEEKYIQAYQKFRAEYISESVFLQFLNENNLDPRLVKLRERAILLRSGNVINLKEGELKKKMEEAQECWRLFESTQKLVTKNAGITPTFDVTKIENIKKSIHELKQDFEKYTALHAAKVGPGLAFRTQEQKQKELREFEGRYGATRPEELVHRMHVASLYLLTHLDMKDLENEKCIDDILDFEKKLASPLFAVDKNYLEDHLYFLEDLNITLYQAKLELETKAGVNAFLKVGGPVETPEETNINTNDDVNLNLSLSAGINAKFKLGLTYGYLSGHRNILRKGHSLQFSVTAGVGINVDATIKALTPDFTKHLPADIAPYALAQLKEKLLYEIALTKSWTSEVTFDFYLAKPNKLSEAGKGFSLSHLLSRKSQTDIVDTTEKKRISSSLIGLPVDLVFGGGNLNIKTNPLEEFCESNTMLQYSILYNHAYDVGEIDKVTREVVKGSYVHVFEKQLDLFFKNLANEPDVKDGVWPEGAISQEIAEFETAVNNNPNYLKQLLVNFETARRASTDPDMIHSLREKIVAVKQAINEHKTSNELDVDGVLKEYNFKRAREKLKKAATIFKDHQARNDIDTPLKRDKAVKRLRKLQHAFNPHFSESKSNSTDLKPRPLATVDGTKAMLAALIQQNQLMQWRCEAGLMM